MDADMELQRTNDLLPEGYRSILDTIFCCILVYNPSGRLILCNSSAQQFFSRLAADMDDGGGAPSHDFSQLLQEQVDLISGMGRYVLELGGIQVICNVHPWLSGGSRRGTVVIFHESKHANCVMQELNVTNSLLRELNFFLETSHDGILVTNAQGIVIRANTASGQAFSVSRRELLGHSVQELVDSGLYERSAVLLAIETQKAATVLLDQKGKSLVVTATPAFDDCGKLSSVVVNIRDITELNDLRSKLEHHRMVAEGYIQELSFLKSQHDSGTAMVAHSKEMQQILDTIKVLSRVDSTLLITGESGTGKEVIVNQVHRSSSRRDKPIVKINCGAIPSALFESELFGYEDGAFTGARRKGKAGFFEMANEGTLFLDEIGELDLELQVKLLRVIQEGEITRIGGTHTQKIDVRIIAATNRDLWKLVEEGRFRRDLYYRLNVINIEVPPLRERRDDILPLATFFVEKYNRKYQKCKKLSMELGKVLRMLDWPGNIRELENLMESMVVLVQRDLLTLDDLPPRYQNPDVLDNAAKVTVSGLLPLKDAVQQVERALLLQAQEKYASTRKIAEVLGVDQSTVSRKLRALLQE